MAKPVRNARKREVKRIEKKVLSKVRKQAPRPRAKARSKQTKIGKVLREVGGTVGGMFGLRGVGTQLGAGISRVFGQGDYRIASTSVAQGGPPAFGSLKSGTRIRHREYIRDISTSVNFSSQAFQINPGMSQLFPWLSSVAVNFEEYKVHGLIVYLNSNSANAIASTNTALGVWGAVTQYDPTEPDFTNKQQAENYQGCTSAVPSSCIMHAVECANFQNVLDRRYVRTAAVADTEDLKFYDLGKLQIFTGGSQAAAVAGEMWVTYDIEFFKPRLPTGGSDSAATDFYRITTTTAAKPLGTGNAIPIGDQFTSIVGSTDTMSIASWAPTGYYSVFIEWIMPAGTYTAPAVTLSGPANSVNYWLAGTQSVLTAPQNGLAGTTSGAFNYILYKSGMEQVNLLFTGFATSTTPSQANINVVRMSSAPFSTLLERKTKLNLDEVKLLKLFLKNLKYEEEFKVSEIDHEIVRERSAERSEPNTSYETIRQPQLTRQFGFRDGWSMPRF